MGLPLISWLVAGAAVVLAYVLIGGGLGLLRSRLESIARSRGSRGAHIAAEVLRGTSQLLIALVALLIGVGLLDVPERWQSRLGQLWFVAVAVQIGLWGTRAIMLSVQAYVDRHAGNEGTATTAQLSASAMLVTWGLRTLLWATVLLAMLANLGVNITAFVASLGIGGIAIALAVQNVLADLLASLAIAVDKPFQVGDFIVAGSAVGTVQHVGLKTTRLRSLSGEQVVMSNTDLLKQTINNFKLMAERRIVFGFGVSYGTPVEQVEQIPGIVRGLIEAEPQLRYDRAHFKGFGESSLDFEVVYIVLDPGYNLYMDLQQKVNLGLMRELQARGVSFALPTRTLHVSTPTSAPRDESQGTGLRPAQS